MAGRNHPIRPILAGALCFCALLAAGAEAAPEGKGTGGGTYNNKSLGIRAQAPSGWKMVADKGSTPSKWARLVTFNDGGTDAQVVLSARNRVAASLDDLYARIRADWDKSKDRLRVSSLRRVPSSDTMKVGSVVVDASFVRKSVPKAGAPPAPPVTYLVRATYYLGAGHEFLLYAQGQKTHWSRLRMPLSKLRGSLQFTRSAPTGPTGEGGYRNDRRGFTCRYPKGYTVIVPQRANHLVQFEGIGDDHPVLSVYALRWTDTIDRDAERLIAYYEDDMGGEATMRRSEVGGNQAMIVTARATVSGADRVFKLALMKRGDELFRLRASMPAANEPGGTRVFRTFVNSFRMKRAPK